MVTLKPDMTAEPDSRVDQPVVPRAVSSGEVLVLAAVVGVALLAWSGLILADVGRYTLSLAFGLALLGWLAVLATAWRVTRPAIVVDKAGLAVLAGLAIVAAVLFLPGFPYGVGDKDPGVYVIHAIEIARTGSIRWTDLALQRVQGTVLTSPGALWPALWVQSPGSAVISPQFYHLWPALLASAFAAGGYTGLTNLVPLLGVLAVLAVAALLGLVALRRFGARAGWFAAGLALTLPHGLVQAYGIAERYTVGNDVPKLRTVVALVVAGTVVALLARWLLPRTGLGERIVALAQDRRVQFRLGVVILALGTGLMAIGVLRPRLFGPAYYLTDNGTGVLPSFDEQSLRRLSWFFTLPGMGMVLVGLGVVALRRWRAAVWTLVLPVLLLTPLYAWHGRVASRLMWWTRRFVPVVVPGLTILLAVGLAAGLTWAVASGRWRWARWPVRVASAVLAVFLLVVFLSQSLPLRQHHEFGGSFELTRRVAQAAGGRQGVFLWQQQSQNRIFSPGGLLGGPLEAAEGQVSVFLPYRLNLDYVHRFTAAFPGQPIFILWGGDQPPPTYASLGLERVDRIALIMKMWMESDFQRPNDTRDVVLDFSIWHIRGT